MARERITIKTIVEIYWSSFIFTLQFLLSSPRLYHQIFIKSFLVFNCNFFVYFYLFAILLLVSHQDSLFSPFSSSSKLSRPWIQNWKPFWRKEIKLFLIFSPLSKQVFSRQVWPLEFDPTKQFCGNEANFTLWPWKLLKW